MNEKIREHVKSVCIEKGWPTDSDQDLFEAVAEGGNEIYSKEVGRHRWWNDVFCVVELGGMTYFVW